MPKDHIEVIARGALVVAGHILLCKSVNSLSKHDFLPGGHVEFAEQARAALVRELKEEAGLSAIAGPMLGVCESSFTQDGKHGRRVHHEINLVFLLSLPAEESRAKSKLPPVVKSREDHIEFHWVPLSVFDPPSRASRGKAAGPRKKTARQTPPTVLPIGIIDLVKKNLPGDDKPWLTVWK